MEKSIQLLNQDEARNLFGDRDRYLRMIRDHFDAKVVARESRVRISGADADVVAAYAAMLRLVNLLRERGHIRSLDVENALLGRDLEEQRLEFEAEGRLDPFQPKTAGQKHYIEAINSNSVTFGIGPAGTGKTFLAVASAVSALVRGHVKRIVLVRPAVEAGESLGFLPGTMQEKVNPYLRPIFDALSAVMPAARVAEFMKRDMIEVAPLAFMRGRTMTKAFVILDEAQNATPKQMLMLLTRLGPKSKAVVTGDERQTDLPYGERSGLSDAVKKLEGVEDIAVCRLSKDDIVRHPLVSRIIERYEEEETLSVDKPVRKERRQERRRDAEEKQATRLTYPGFNE